jgi:hypothetical protein
VKEHRSNPLRLARRRWRYQQEKGCLDLGLPQEVFVVKIERSIDQEYRPIEPEVEKFINTQAKRYFRSNREDRQDCAQTLRIMALYAPFTDSVEEVKAKILRTAGTIYKRDILPNG